jgi:hypothetical protein
MRLLFFTLVLFFGGCGAYPDLEFSDEGSIDSEVEDMDGGSLEDSGSDTIGTDEVDTDSSDTIDTTDMVDTVDTADTIDTADTETSGDDDDDLVDTDSIFDGLCDFITCPEFPTYGQEVKFRSLCVPSDFPNVVPDTITHYAAGSGECFEIVGGYECLYQEYIVECELEQRCGQQYLMDDPGYTSGVCLDRNL